MKEKIPGPSQTEQIYNKGIAHWKHRLAQDNMTHKDTLLEVGFGDGQWLIASSHTCKKVIGVEPEKTKIKNTRQKIKEHGADNIEIVAARAEHLPFKSSMFDAILCYGVLIYTNKEKTVREIAWATKKQGAVLIETQSIGYFILRMFWSIKQRNMGRMMYSIIVIIRSVVYRCSKPVCYATVPQIELLCRENNISVTRVSMDGGLIGNDPHRCLGFPVNVKMVGVKG